MQFQERGDILPAHSENAMHDIPKTSILMNYVIFLYHQFLSVTQLKSKKHILHILCMNKSRKIKTLLSENEYNLK